MKDKNVINDSNYSQVASDCCLISYFDARKFESILVPAIFKINPFSHHLAVLVQLHSKFGLLALFCVSLKRLQRFFKKSLHLFFTMYIIMSETLIKIDSLQHLEILRQPYPTNRSKMTLCKFFKINADIT